MRNALPDNLTFFFFYLFKSLYIVSIIAEANKFQQQKFTKLVEANKFQQQKYTKVAEANKFQPKAIFNYTNNKLNIVVKLVYLQIKHSQ